MTNSRSGLWAKVTKFAWVALFYFSLIFVAIRLVLGGDGSASALGLKITFAALLYCLFLLEGLLVVGTQLKSSDHDAIITWLNSGVAPSQTAKSTQLFRIFHDQFEEFVAGRQILVMAIIVGMTICVEHLHILHYSLPWADSILSAATKNIPDNKFIHILLNSTTYSYLASFILITLVPCWISQLLPQFLADGRSFEFINVFPLTGTAVRLSMFVSHIGAGLPGSHALLVVQRAMRKFVGNEAFGVGDRSLFDKLTASIGYNISQRTIRIQLTPTGFRVTDKSVYCFISGQHLSLVHAIRTPSAGVELGEWQLEVSPTVRCGKPIARALKNTVTQDAPGKIGELLYENQIISSELKFQMPIPHAPGEQDLVTLTAEYTIQYPDILGEHEFIIDIPKLTKSIDIIIECDAPLAGASELLICKPKAQFYTINGSLLPDIDHSIRPDTLLIQAKDDGRGWLLKREYLPFNSLLEIKLDCTEEFTPARREN